MELVAPAGPVYQAGTLSANPVGMRAGLATLYKIESVKAYEKLEAKTARFCDELSADFQNSVVCRFRLRARRLSFGCTHKPKNRFAGLIRFRRSTRRLREKSFMAHWRAAFTSRLVVTK